MAMQTRCSFDYVGAYGGPWADWRQVHNTEKHTNSTTQAW